MTNAPVRVIVYWLFTLFFASPGVFAADLESLAPRVPIANDEELFAAFALDRPELAAVKSAVESKNYKAARAALLDYYRQRRSPLWFENSWQRPAASTNAPPALIQNAEKVLAHEFSASGSTVKFDGPIDWRYLPARLSDGSPDYQLPLVLYINRFTWWRDALGPAYWATGDERYAAEWASEVQDWVTRNPAPTTFNEKVAPSPWRRLTTAHSIPMWISGLNYFLSSNAVTPDTIAAYFKGIVTKTRFTIRNPETVNRRLLQIEAVHAVSSYFPELRDAAKWRQWSLEELDRFIEEEIYPDGSTKELAPGFETVVMASLRDIVAFSTLNGDKIPVRYLVRDTLGRIAEYLADIMLPDGTLPAFGETWPPAFVAGELLKTLEFYPTEKGKMKLDRLRYQATLGREGAPPATTSTAAPWAGIYVQRSHSLTNNTAQAIANRNSVPTAAGWRFGDLALAFRAGAYGTDHQHEDKLSFVLYGFGARLVDSMGVYGYADTPWREFFRSTAASNTLLVDGMGQNRRAKPQTWTTSKPLEGNVAGDDTFDFVSGVYDDGWGPANQRTVSQRREIFFVKPDYWIMHDVLNGTGNHTYESLFHFQPANSVQVHDQTKVIFTDNLRRPNLVIYPVDADIDVQVTKGWSVNPTDSNSPRQGWFSPGLQKVEPAPCAIQRRRGSAPQVIENIMLAAMPADTADISAQRLAVTDEKKNQLSRTEVCALRITTRNSTEIYINDLRVENLLDVKPRMKKIAAGRLGEIEFSGKLLLIRLNNTEQPVLVRHVGGSAPTRGGRELVAPAQ